MRKNTLARSKRPDAPKSFVICSAQGSKSVSLMIDSTISTTCSLCVRRRRMITWVTGPVAVIRPLPTLWSSLGGNGCFDCLSLAGVPSPFLSGWLSFPSLFRLDVPLPTILGANIEAPSFSFCLSAVVDALTKTLCFATSISAKGKR